MEVGGFYGPGPLHPVVPSLGLNKVAMDPLGWCGGGLRVKVYAWVPRCVSLPLRFARSHSLTRDHDNADDPRLENSSAV